jgi:hypothetical protein
MNFNPWVWVRVWISTRSPITNGRVIALPSLSQLVAIPDGGSWLHMMLLLLLVWAETQRVQFYVVVFCSVKVSNLDILPCNLIWGFTQKMISIWLSMLEVNLACFSIFICCLVRQLDKAVVSMDNLALSGTRQRRACRAACLGSSIMPDWSGQINTMICSVCNCYLSKWIESRNIASCSPKFHLSDNPEFFVPALVLPVRHFQQVASMWGFIPGLIMSRSSTPGHSPSADRRNKSPSPPTCCVP